MTKEQIAACEETMEAEASALQAWEAEAATLPPVQDMGQVLREITKHEETLKYNTQELHSLSTVQSNLEVLIGVETRLPSAKEEISKRDAQIAKLQGQLVESESQMKEAGAMQVITDISLLDIEEKATAANITRAKTMLENIEKDEDDLRIANEKISDLRQQSEGVKDKTKKVLLVKDAFGAKGIKTLVIDFMLPKLEDRVNEVLAKLSDFRVRFDTQRKSSDGENMVEGLYLFVYNEGGEEMQFENLSGGERVKVSVAITEALATLQKCGFRIFDEFVTALDENSLEGFMIAINHLQTQYPQMLMVSHIQEVKDLFDKSLMIRKNNNISYVD